MRKVFFFLLLVVIPVSPVLAGSLHLGEKGVDLTGSTFQAGMMKVAFQEGSGVLVKWEDLPIGFLFTGKGMMEVTVTDPYARQVLDFNLRHGSHLDAKDNKIKDTFTDAMFLGTQALELLKGKANVPRGSKEKSLKKFEADFLDQYLVSPPSFILAGIHNGDTMAAAMLSGGKDELIFTYDPTWTGEENLYALEKSTIRRVGKSNLRWSHNIINQPLNHPREKPFLSPIVLKALEYQMDWTDLSRMVALYKITLSVRRGRFQAIPFDLVSRQLYFGGDEGGVVLFENGWAILSSGITTLYPKVFRVGGVGLKDGTPLSFTHQGDVLTVQLPKPAKAGDTLELIIVGGGNIFEPTPLMGSYVTLSGAFWFPSPLAGYESIDALFSGTIKTKEPIKAFASLEHYSIKKAGDVLIMQGYSSHPESYHAIAVGKYFPKTMQKDDITITMASAVQPNKRAYTLLSGLTKGILDLYTFFLGDFPYDHLDIIEGRGLGYGHAPANMVFASGEIFNSLKDYATRLFSRGANERFAHEIAHQYYGHLVRMPRLEDNWLTEAVSEYMAAFFLGRAKSKSEFKHLYNYWYATAKRSSPMASIYARNLLAGHDAEVYRWELTYCKGPLLIHAIHKKLGDKLFWTLLRSFLRSFPYQAVTTEDFIGLLNYLTKEDWHPFFKTYLYGTEMPPKQKP